MNVHTNLDLTSFKWQNMINNKKYHLLIRKVEGKGGISGKLKYKFHYNSNFSTP